MGLPVLQGKAGTDGRTKDTEKQRRTESKRMAGVAVISYGRPGMIEALCWELHVPHSLNP